jgi:ABC-2 type transport system ATP-binding protein
MRSVKGKWGAGKVDKVKRVAPGTDSWHRFQEVERKYLSAGDGVVAFTQGATMPSVISTRGLTKYYGKTPGIVDLDLTVRTGEVFGFLGPNGAGKSTTIRVLLDFLHPSRGWATIFGLDSRRDSVAIRRRVGYLPADLALYPQMTARELFGYFSAVRHVDAGRRIGELAERFELDLDRRISGYSSGMRQKAGIIQAFMHDPELLILDEPTGGLDPLMQHEFSALIDETRSAGRTVFLSSHVLPEVERLADRVGIVRRSRLVALEDVEALKDKALRHVELTFAERVEPEAFRGLDGVRELAASDDGLRLTLQVAGRVEAVIVEAARRSATDLVSHEAELEEIFLAHYGQAGNDAP